MTATAPLAEAARLVAGLRPDWRNAEMFYQRRSEALSLLRAAASPCAVCPAEDLRERARRLEALLRQAATETNRLRRMLASVRRPPHRRRCWHDPRQATLPLPGCGIEEIAT